MRSKIIRLLFSKTLFFIVTTTIILGLNLTPLILQTLHSPPGRSFVMVHNNVQDFFFYQSLMNEGANGSWLISDPYTTEPHQSSIIFAFFAWLGKLSRFIQLPYAMIYNLSRIVLGLFFLLASYSLILLLKLPHPRLTYLLFLFAGPFLHKGVDGNPIPYMYWWTGMDPIRRAAYLPHHMAGSLMLIITVILLINYLNSKVKSQKSQPEADQPRAEKLQLKSQNYKYLLFTILLSPVLAFIHTPSLLINLLVLPATIFIQYILYQLPLILNSKHEARNSKPIPESPFGLPRMTSFWQSAGWRSVQNLLLFRIWDKEFGISKIIGLSVYWVIGLFFLFLMISQTKNGFPWSQYIDWEKKLQFPLDKELWGAFGILLPFAILGTIIAFLSKRLEYILVACWFLVPLVFIPFAQKLNISNIRLIQGAPYLPLAILATLGISALESFIRQIILILNNSKFKIQNSKLQLKIKNLYKNKAIPKETISEGEPNAKIADIINPSYLAQKIGNQDKRRAPEKFVSEGLPFIVIMILIIFFYFTYPALKWSLKDQIREYWPIFGNVYLDNRLYQAFDFINKNYPPRTATLSTFYTGNYLPAYTHTVSFIGHFGYTYNIDEKQQKVKKFFENKMADTEAKEFLVSNKIVLIFQGPEENPIYKDYLYPKILKPVYEKEEVTLYVLP